MGTARRVGITLSALLALAMAAASIGLWPLVRKTDAAYIAHLQRDVDFGWLLLQAATPLFVLSTTAGVAAAALAWRLATARAASPARISAR